MVLLILLMAAGAALPITIAYGRRLDDWTMMRFWAWLMLPVAGWVIAMYIALTAPSRS